MAVFACEGGREVGYGHLSRCLSIANALAEAGWSILFVTNLETAEGWMLRSASFPVALVDNFFTSPEQFVKISKAENAALLILDSYKFSENLELALSGGSLPVMVIADAPSRKFFCSLILDSSPGRTASEYKSLVHPRCEMLLGQSYMPLSGNVENFKWTPENIEVSPLQVFLNFGGIDSRGLNLQALQLLERLNQKIEINAVVSSGTPWNEELVKFKRNSRHGISLHFDARNSFQIMANCAISLGGAGINAMERAAVGLPSLIACAAENQRPNFNALIASGAAVPIELNEKGQIDQDRYFDVEKFLIDKDACLKLSLAGRRFCDGKGAWRISEQIRKIVL